MIGKNVAYWPLMVLVLTACHSPKFYKLPDGVNAVHVGGGSGEWTVTVRNAQGSATSTMFAANDHQRTNLYITSKGQLVVIEQGGSDAFFTLPKDSAPEPLDDESGLGRDTHSDKWRYVGVIINGTFFSPERKPECIALIGEGRSPYRKAYQVPSFC